MRSFYQLSLVLSVFLLSCSPCLAEHSSRHEGPRVRHQRTNRLNNVSDTKYKRDLDVAFTYFQDGQGACGTVNGPNDFIVALNSAEYAGGAHCWEMVVITIGGKTAVAQVTDECLGCSPGGLDFSQGLFEYFAPLDEGELHGSWVYLGQAASSSTPTSWTSSTLTSPTPTPTSSTAITTSASTTPSSTSTIPSVPTFTSQNPQMLTQINVALLELGLILQASLKLEA